MMELKANDLDVDDDEFDGLDDEGDGDVKSCGSENNNKGSDGEDGEDSDSFDDDEKNGGGGSRGGANFRNATKYANSDVILSNRF